MRIGLPIAAAVGVLAVPAITREPALLVVTVIAALVIGQIAGEVLVAIKADLATAGRIRADLERAGDTCLDLTTTTPLPAPSRCRLRLLCGPEPHVG